MNKLEIIFIIFIFLMVIVLHEITHYEIYRAHNCKDIGFKIGIKGISIYATCPTDNQDLAQNINEIVGYNIMPFLMLIVMLLFIDKKCQ